MLHLPFSILDFYNLLENTKKNFEMNASKILNSRTNYFVRMLPTLILCIQTFPQVLLE